MKPKKLKWKDSESVSIILDKIASYIAIQPDGKIGSSSFDVYDHIATLVSLTDFSEEIPEEQKSEFMWSAISATFKRKKKNGRDLRGILLEEIRRQQDLYLKQACKEYVLLTSLSIRKPGNLTRKKIGEHWITFHNRKPTKFDIASLLTRVDKLIPGELPKNNTYVTVSCQGRCEYAAARKAFESLDFLRGIWNFWHHYWKPEYRYDKLDPVNKIVLGPHHSLHEKNGKLVKNTFWWEPSYRTPKIPLSLSTEWEQITQFEKLAKRRIAKTAFSTFIETALIKYVRALDESDFSVSFLKLWQVLEYVTMTGGNKYDVTIKRTLSLLKNSEYHKIILNDLKEKRNNLVHENSQLRRSYETLQQLIRYVNELLRFMIDLGYRFSNEEKLKEFLDLPVIKEELDTKEKDVKLAKKLRGYNS